jgi:hypothetical protein
MEGDRVRRGRGRRAEEELTGSAKGIGGGGERGGVVVLGFVGFGVAKLCRVRPFRPISQYAEMALERETLSAVSSRFGEAEINDNFLISFYNIEK